MSMHLVARRRAIRRTGRPMTLRRSLTTSTHEDVTVQGVTTLFKPEAIGTGNVRQGDAMVAILNDEIEAADWPGPPRAADAIIDGKTWQVIGVYPVWDGTTCVGFNLYLRGGA